VGAAIMLVTLIGLIVLIVGLVMRFDPEARGGSASRGPVVTSADPEGSP
jgi:hypothetical protein